MPAEHKIDHDMKLITTIWYGEVIDNELIDALMRYHRDITSQLDYGSYNEILDFSEAGNINLSTEGIKRLARIAGNRDVRGVKNKLAIIVNKPFVFGLGRMYASYRSLESERGKEVHVFMNYRDAIEWIEKKTGY